MVGVRPPEELMLQHDRVNLEQRCEARVKFCCTSQRRKKELALNCRRDRIREKDGSQQTVHRMLERASRELSSFEGNYRELTGRRLPTWCIGRM